MGIECGGRCFQSNVVSREFKDTSGLFLGISRGFSKATMRYRGISESLCRSLEKVFRECQNLMWVLQGLKEFLVTSAVKEVQGIQEVSLDCSSFKVVSDKFQRVLQGIQERSRRILKFRRFVGLQDFRATFRSESALP